MSRWIDADAELKRLKAMKVEGETFITAVQFAITVLEEAPSIDIVRCGECKRHKPSKIWAETKPCIVEPFPSIRCKMLDREVSADDFCSYGEREGE